MYDVSNFCGSFVFLFCLVFAVSLCTSVCVCFVVACWEGADLLALISQSNCNVFEYFSKYLTPGLPLTFHTFCKTFNNFSLMNYFYKIYKGKSQQFTLSIA